jgi:hypothetical protein
MSKWFHKQRTITNMAARNHAPAPQTPEEREAASWRALNDLQASLLAIVSETSGKATPSTLTAIWSARNGGKDLHQTLENIWKSNKALHRSEPDPKNFAHRVIAMNAIGRRVDY